MRILLTRRDDHKEENQQGWSFHISFSHFMLHRIGFLLTVARFISCLMLVCFSFSLHTHAIHTPLVELLHTSAHIN